MRYALLIYDNPGAYDGFTDEERKALSARYWALREEPGVADGAGLQPVQTATTVRIEDDEALVGDRRRRVVHLGLNRLLGYLEQPRLRRQRALAPQPIDRAVARRRDQPRGGVLRRAAARPAFGGDGERLLDGLLGAIEVPEEADQSGEHAAPLLAEDPLDQRGYSTTGRISIAPP